MVTGTVIRLARAARAVRRLDLAEAAKQLGVPLQERVRVQRRKGHSRRIREFKWPSSKYWRSKTVANGWLFYSYGVKPLMQDVYNGMDVLQRPFPYHVARASGRMKDAVRHVLPFPPYGADIRSYRTAIRLRAWVQVKNPNLWLANQLGLVNPASWLLEAIPLSFVVDWFSNLSQVVS